jgi:hypothetical protein
LWLDDVDPHLFKEPQYRFVAMVKAPDARRRATFRRSNASIDRIGGQ